MTRLILLAALWLALPSTAVADDKDDKDDMDFLDLEAGEANRKARIADRAPDGVLFLEDEEEPLPQWKTDKPKQGPVGNLPVTPREEIDNPTPPIQTALVLDPDDREEEDPEDDLSPRDRISIMKPLSDNFPLTLVNKAQGQITVELPVLVAQDSSDFSGEDYWLVAQVVVNGTPISEGRHLITPSAISPTGPTKVWFKLAVPVDGPEADVKVKILQAPARGGSAQPLFSRSLTVRM